MLKRLAHHVRDRLAGKVPRGKKRSGGWPTVRKRHLAKHPACEVCGGKKKLEVHHIRPFHVHPELELDPKNLITLCETGKHGVSCHLWFGHLGNFTTRYNLDVYQDAADWDEKVNEADFQAHRRAG